MRTRALDPNGLAAKSFDALPAGDATPAFRVAAGVETAFLDAAPDARDPLRPLNP